MIDHTGQIRKNKVTGAIECLSAYTWSHLANRDEWEIIEPENQLTPQPEAKAQRKRGPKAAKADE